MGSKVAQKGAQRAATTFATRSAASAADNAAGKALGKSNLAARALRSPAVRKALVRKLGAAGAKKLTTKIAAKLIPGISTAYGLGEGLTRIALGDVKGGFLSFGSAIPIAGYGFAAIDIFRDIDIDAYTKHIEPNLPAPSDENVGAFFAEALGVMPNQYEQGTARSRRGLASPGPAMLHGKEAILTPEDRRRITQFSVDSINTTGSKMVSTAIGLGDASGNGSTVRSIFNKLGVDYLLERVPFRFDVGKKSSGGASISSMFSDAATAVAGMVGMNTESNSNTSSNNRNGAFTGLPQEYQKFYDYLVSKGASPNHAMGMVLNLARESSANPGAMANWEGTGLDSNGKPSGGLFQWNGARFTAMKAFVGSDWKTDWRGQLDFAMAENDPQSGGYRAYSQIDFDTPMAAAEWWLKKWERGLDPAEDMNKMRTILSNWRASGLKQQSGPVSWSLDDYLTAPSGVKIDGTGEPGVDFTPAGPNNKAMFDGIVIETGNQYNAGATGGDNRPGSGYGNFIIIRSTDPKNGKQFDSLYAHFPQGELNRWSNGDTVKRGDVLGRMATEAEFANPATRPQVGSGTGPHTSLDFFPPGGPYVKSNPYPDWKTNLLPLIDPSVSTSPVSSNNLNNPRSAASNQAAQEAAKLAAHRKRQAGGGSGYGEGGGNGTSATTPMMGTGGSGGGPVYGQSLKFKSPIPQYPNYEKPNDYFGKFFKKVYDAAVKAGDPFPEVVAAQACEESDYGRSNLAKHANNLFGQDAPTGANPNDHYPYFDPVEQKHHVGMRFASIEDAVRYRVNTWKKYYGNARTPAEAIRNIARGGYNPHAPYPGKIDELLRNFGVEPNTPRPFQLQREQKINVNDPRQSPGPKGIIESLKDDEGLSRFIPPALRNMIPGELQRRSSLMEDMEDAGGIKVQYVIINNAVAVNKPSSVNSNRSSSTTRSTSLSELHLASLGA